MRSLSMCAEISLGRLLQLYSILVYIWMQDTSLKEIVQAKIKSLLLFIPKLCFFCVMLRIYLKEHWETKQCYVPLTLKSLVLCYTEEGKSYRLNK